MDEPQNQGWFWSILGLLQSNDNSNCNQSLFFKKKIDFFYLKKEEYTSKLTADRSN